MPRAAWLPARPQYPARTFALLTGADKFKYIRHSLAFPIGISWIWENDTDEIPEFVRMWAEWGLFNGISVASRGAYSSTAGIYLRWCDRWGKGPAFPMSEDNAALFASCRLCIDEIAVDTVVAGFTHLKKFHLNWGYPEWDWKNFFRLKETLHGWKKSCNAPNRNQRKAWRFVFFERWLAEIGVNTNNYIEVLVFTTCLIWFWAIARGGEIWASSAYEKDVWRVLTKKHLKFFENHAVITLDMSKNDAFHEGSALLIPEVPGSECCPIKWLERLTALRQQATNEPYGFDKCKWLFPSTTGRPLAIQAIRRYMIPILIALGEDPNHYNTHSFRIGAATELFQRGMDKETIKHLGRWRGPSYELYNRPTAEQCAIYAKAIVGKPILRHLRHINLIFGDEYTH